MHSQCSCYVYHVNTLCTVRSKVQTALGKIAFHFVFVFVYQQMLYFCICTCVFLYCALRVH